MNLNRVAIVLSIVLFVVSVWVSVQAQAVQPDRISFYNVPSDSGKYILHIDYADGREVRASQGACEDGRVIEQQLNLYQATFITEGCTADIHQHLNLRWLGGCEFNFEDDPDTRIVTRGDYGELVITGHYPQGAVTLPIPVGTISMTAIMSYTIDGILRTGNVGFDFDTPQGCAEPPATATPTSTETPTVMPTTIDDTVQTPTATPTEIIVIDDATPTPTMTEVVSVCCPEVPATTTPTPIAPTALTPESEPGRMMYLPVVSR